MHAVRFPAETEAYRSARNELLVAERDLRRQVEAVAALRRHLPLGGAVPEDYVFEEDDGPVRMSALFGKEPEGTKTTLVLYNFMFSADMDHACPMCTSFLDGLNGNAQHIQQRINLAVVAKSPMARLRAYAEDRGWTNLRMLSSEDNHFNRDFHGDAEDGSQSSIIHTFVLRAGAVHHFYSSELSFMPSDPGQNHRHIDLMWPLWNVLDLTPEGRGNDWFPKRDY